LPQFKSDELVKSQKAPVIVIPVKLVLDLIGERESRKINFLWTPAFAGVTAMETFYETIKSNQRRNFTMNKKAFVESNVKNRSRLHP